MPEVKEVYTREDVYKACIYLNVDESGNITESLTGKNVIPDKPFQFFFLEDAYVSVSIRNYKVAIDNFTPKLQAIDLELEASLKEKYLNVES